MNPIKTHLQIAVEPPDESARVHELYAWIAITRDGGEGILSADLETAIGKRHCPLITGDHKNVEALSKLAAQVKDEHARNGIFVTVEMRTYLLKCAPPPGDTISPANMMLAAGFIRAIADGHVRPWDETDKKILDTASRALVQAALGKIA